jgi:hypothetical protein
MTDARRSARRAAIAHAGLALCAGLLLLAVGQPIITDDLWWHLALGRAFTAHGPWLAEDPLLFAPAGPPSPASWLSDVALAGVLNAAGFYALRALHVAAVAAILALAWVQLRRASGSRAIASLATTAFTSLAAYRLLQLRPELVSIAATLLCYSWLLADERPPSWRRLAAIAALFALWANMHAGFPLGLLLIGAAIAGLVLAAPLRTPEQRRNDRARALRLTAALGIAGIATLANPAGVGTHLAYLVAGVSTPSLDRVVDEWAPTRLFSLPSPPQPSPLAWALAWVLVIALAWSIGRWLARARTRGDLDPAKIAVSLLSLGLLISAVRFLWLGVLPLLLLAPRANRRGAAWIGAAARLLAAGFVKFGERMVTRDDMLSWAYYERPYAAGKHFAHAIWLLADSRVRGNLYAEYFLGGFAGYWLAPEVRTLVNGTLNVPSETLDAVGAIAQRSGLRPGEDFPALLDRLGIDLFLGTRVPAQQRTAAGAITTAHLENTPGWIPIFRNLSGAVYLRSNERNRPNLDRLVDYYARSGVPFDRERGFDVDSVIRERPDWAIAHGVVPHGFVRMARNTVAGRAGTAALDRVATIGAVLGRYERAIAIDRGLVHAQPRILRVRRRLVWSLLRSGHYPEAAVAASELEALTRDWLSARIAKTAQQIAALEAEPARAAIATLPFLTVAEGDSLQQGIEPPAPRPPRLDPPGESYSFLRNIALIRNNQ